MNTNLAGGDKTTTTTVPSLNVTTENTSTIGNSTIPYSQNISMNNFLEFLKITCHVNDSIMFCDNAPNGKEELNYDQLANNKMINHLMGNHFKDTIYEGITTTEYDEQKCDKTNPLQTASRRFSTLSVPMTKSKSQMTRGLHPVLKTKLDEVINEGILDSVLPFICPAIPTNYATHTPAINSNLSTTIQQKGSNKDHKTRDICSIPIIKGNGNNSALHTTQTVPHFQINCPNDKDNNSEVPSVSEKFNTRLTAGSIKIKDSSSKGARRKSVAILQPSTDSKARDITEVIIHVCDEVKNTSRDFSCAQHLLVSKMGYFADVTAGQKLEDMDISVHCDIQIFEWLMKWVKKDYYQPSPLEVPPQLDATNVIPILVSASFLQMEPLLEDCLSFCHSRLNDVVRSSANLSCLNDIIISRLASMFTNLELEVVRDKRERITPRLWTKLIISLFEPEAEVLRGHYFSLGGIFRCQKCGKILTQSVCPYVNCIASNMRLNRWGQLVSQHIRDSTWDITYYVAILFKELKSWRKVYWKLWGHCHFLYCCICETHFPAYQMNWCQFHSEQPQFLGPVTEGQIAGPAGRFACCGQQAFRYETLPGPNGCQYREHSILVETDRDKAILMLTQIAGDGGALYENPPPRAPQNSYSNYEPRWSGMCLMPTKCRQGLLPPLHVDEYHAKIPRRIRLGGTPVADSSSETESSDTGFPDRFCKISQQFSMTTTSSEGCESETNSPRRHFRTSKHRRIKTSGRFWCGEFSARSNQDNQRDFEERVMKQVVNMIGKKTGTETKLPVHSTLSGGTYVRLEAEWKDHIKHKSFNNLKPKTK